MAKKVEAVEEAVKDEEIKEAEVEAVEEAVEMEAPVIEETGDKKYLVETPVPNFQGIVAGVHFAYGKAEVKAGWILDWFKEKGYKVTEVK